MAGLLDLISEAYMRNVGNPARQLVGGGVRGLLGFDPPEYADRLGMEAYRNAAAMGNAPGINAPVGAFKAAAKVVPEAAMFIGALAKTWDKASNAKAVQMEKAGKDAREIWRETGNLKGPDGKWRQEISDSGSMPGHRLYSPQEAQDLASGDFAVVQRQKALLHPQLSAAYPDTKNIGVRLTPGAPGGYYTAGMDYIEAGSSKNGAANRSVMLHELQHAIQQREGFAQGGSPGMGERAPFVYGGKADQRMKEIERLFDSVEYDSPAYKQLVGEYRSLQPKSEAEAAFEGYRRLAGEAEARATQARMNMKPAERRATFPYDSYDVPVDQLIVRGLLAP